MTVPGSIPKIILLFRFKSKIVKRETEQKYQINYQLRTSTCAACFDWISFVQGIVYQAQF